MSTFDLQAQEEFVRALKKARIQTVLSKLQLERSELLPFYDIKKLVKPKRQTYKGTYPIKVAEIMGSEGRYRDFTKAFLPKKSMLKNRWMNINKAHQQMVDLPSISVYKLGNAYFVRDGNHRVSVAKTMGVEFIDAEVVELDSEIVLEPGMTDRQVREKVIDYERKRVLKQTSIGSIIDMDTVTFTAPGRYTEMLHHIEVHKYYMNMERPEGEEIPFKEAAVSWYENIYSPIVAEIADQKLLSRFPGRSAGDLYMWIVKHWDRLKDDYGKDVSFDDASRDFAEQYKLSPLRWLRDWLVKSLHKKPE